MRANFGIGWDGVYHPLNEYYDGVIDSAAVWNKTLTSSEVATLYNTSDKSGYHLTMKEYDTEIGLYYFWQRWYDAITGRFTQKSAFAAGTEHPYVYCANMAVNRSDPTGEIAIVPYACVACGACATVKTMFCIINCALSYWDDPSQSFGECYNKCLKDCEIPGGLNAACGISCAICLKKVLDLFKPKGPKITFPR
jgi:RHS repeat-associated protein